MGLGNAIVRGIISEEPTIRTVTTRDGQEVDVASFRIRDQTGEVRVSLWRDLVEKVRNLPLEADIRVKNVYVRTGFDGSLELSSKSTTEVEVLSKSEEEASGTLELGDEEKPRRISELEEGETAHIKGKIIEFSKTSQVYSSCPNCRRKVKAEEGGKWICGKCGEIPQPVHTLLVNALVEDSTGRIATVFRGSLAEKLVGMTADYAWNIAAQTGDERSPIETVSKKLVGKNVNIVGRVRVNSSSGSLRLLVENIK
jgi:replication factor A1